MVSNRFTNKIPLLILFFIGVTSILIFSTLQRWQLNTLGTFIGAIIAGSVLVCIGLILGTILPNFRNAQKTIFNTVLSTVLLLLLGWLLFLLLQPWIEHYAERFERHRDMGLLETLDEPPGGGSSSSDGKGQQNKQSPQEQQSSKPPQDFQDKANLEDKVQQGNQLIMLAYLQERHHIRRLVLSAFNETDYFYRAPNPYEEDLPYRSVNHYYDADPKRISRLKRGEFSAISLREKWTQRYYVIDFSSEALFGVNEPILMRPIGNPIPSFFKTTFKTNSYGNQLNPFIFTFQASNYASVSSDFVEYYTQSSKDEAYHTLAQSIIGDAHSPFEKVKRIKAYLEEHYYYSLSPGGTDVHDRLKYFLFEVKRGYCTYFAFAFTMLARSVGVPTRVATGFLPNPQREYYQFYLITGKDLHAWPEVYFDETGWITYDIEPLPPGIPDMDMGTVLPQDNPASRQERELLEELVHKILGIKEQQPDETSTSDDNATQPVSVGVILLYMALGLLVLYLLLWLWKQLRRQRYRLYHTMDKRIVYSYLSYLYDLNDAGWGRNHGETHMQCMHRISDIHPGDGSTFTTIFLSARFDRTVNQNQITFWNQHWNTYRRTVMRSLSPLNKIRRWFSLRSVFMSERRR